MIDLRSDTVTKPTPAMRRAPSASTRACSTASKTARAKGEPGARLLCTASS